MKMQNIINFNSQIWKEGNMFVSHSPELKVASCGKTIEQAKKKLKRSC